jgi:sulfite exporter TauE/SafE
VVHGLAGSAAVALLVLTTIGKSGWALAYLMVFGLGTVVGMMLITAAIAWPFRYTRGRFLRLHHGLRFASGVLSLGVGLVLAYEIAKQLTASS